MPPEPAPAPIRAGVKWNEVTWYSKLGAIVLFVGVVPSLCFYIGMQYQAVLDITLVPATFSLVTAPRTNSHSTVSSSRNVTSTSILYSDDKKYGAAEVAVDEWSDLQIFQGKALLETYSHEDIAHYGFDGLKPHHWAGHVLYAVNTGVGAEPSPIAVIDADKNTFSAISIPGASPGGEFVFSSDSQKIAYTDKPWFGDSVAQEEWLKNPSVVGLYVFYLDSKKRETLFAKSDWFPKNVRWVSTNTVSYTNSETGETGTVSIDKP